MANDILLPALYPSMEEGKLIRWCVSAGDRVRPGDILCEIETEKASMEHEADRAGVIDALLLKEGSDVLPVGTPIARITGDVTDAPKRARPQRLTVREALRDAMAEEMRADGDVFILGEEVGEAQGSYRVTQGLWEEFGSRRVVDMPPAPLGFAGLGVGAAFAGLKPVVEFMSFNFAMQALDQIVNSAAKTRYMTGGALHCPIVFRGPNGSASRVGAQHAQDFAALYTQIPGLKVLAPYSAQDAKALLKAAIRDPDPVIFLEHEMLYGQSFDMPEGDILPIGKARIWREGGDVTLVSFGIGVSHTIKAAEALALEGISAEVIDLRSLRPLDHETIIHSVRKTNRCVTVEEGFPGASIGSQISALLMQEAFDWLDAPVINVTGADIPMPYAANLEEAAQICPDKIVSAARKVLYRGE